MLKNEFLEMFMLLHDNDQSDPCKCMLRINKDGPITYQKNAV